MSKTTFYEPTTASINVDSLSESASLHLAQAYYAVWCVAAFSEIASVITVTILLIHISLMISHYDMLWFVVHWNFVSHVMPQMFLIIGSFCLIFGCCLGSLLLADKVTGGIVIFVAGIVTIVLVVNWLFMLDRNKKHQIKSIEKFRKILKEQLKIHMQKEHGQMK